ncbi:MmgE/PrpD family protein [Microbacterium sp. SLBN-146]|uniref:MmgE/PrpD family protein n=1 Tax=Microbacterium sp. SLBN-146 TaxID=2768457 RepID=UPI0011520DE5|nr:MmgE/PrpD family protein [Microbacterium sp. SLBN-146]TQJ30733.1 2-methylcitrate dehydratase PrpD [Microbacterium sp. SLBN-146]
MTDSALHRDSWRASLRGRALGAASETRLAPYAARILVDDVAAMLSGADDPRASAFATASTSSGGEATIVSGGSDSRIVAAQKNGLLAGWDELDEGYRRAGCHGGLYTVPAAMAECEAEDRTLQDLLEAITVGYEVVATIARHIDPPRARAVHPHSYLSPIGAATTLVWLRTRDPAMVVKAVDVAATLAPRGDYRLAHDGILARNLWAAAGAGLGFLAADATLAGIDADTDALADMTTGARADDAAWAVEDGYHKVYAACQYTHSAIEAASALASPDAQHLDVARIAAIDVATHPLGIELGDAHPTTSLGGKFSLPHVVAATLVAGRTDPEVYSQSWISHPAVARLRSLVRIHSFEPLPPYPHDRPARVTLVFDDGRREAAECLSAIGEPGRPMSADQLVGKISQLTAHRAPEFSRIARQLIEGGIDSRTRWRPILSSLLGTPEGEHA